MITDDDDAVIESAEVQYTKYWLRKSHLNLIDSIKHKLGVTNDT